MIKDLLKLYPKSWLMRRLVNSLERTSKRIKVDKDEEQTISGFIYVMD